VGARSYAQFPSAPGTGPGLAETIEAIDSARVTTRILYVTAHPDDESAAVADVPGAGAACRRGAAFVDARRRRQNALGPEQAPQLGLIRTQELLAATRGLWRETLFLREREDFGFSKTPEETEKILGRSGFGRHGAVIRTFRPIS